MSRTISSSTTGPVVLGPLDNPLTITSTGTVTATGSGVDGIDAPAGTTWSITNAGVVISSANYGIQLAGAGSVTNSGSISGADGLGFRAGGAVVNAAAGSISGLGTFNSGIHMTGGSGTVANYGRISGSDIGVNLQAGGRVTNAAGGSILGSGDAGVFFNGQTGTVINSGTVNATGTNGAGVYLEMGGNITNNSTGMISGRKFGAFLEGGFGTIANYGSISSPTYDGVVVGHGGVVTNAAGASIAGGNNGVYVKYRAAGTITNSGSISATGTNSAGVDLADGGSVTNNSGASLSGSSFGVFITGGSSTVTNAGTISGGSYSVFMGTNAANRLVVDPGAIFNGAVGGGGTLELASGTGSIGGINNGSFLHFQSVVDDTGGSWTLTGTDAVSNLANNGTLAIAGSLDVSTAIDPSSTGVFQLDGGATFEVAAALGTKMQMNFVAGSELLIDSAASFGVNVGTSSYAGPQLQDFVAGDTIDLKNFSAAGVTLNYNSSSGVLQVANGASQAASLEFQTSSLGSGIFHDIGDGATGIFLTHS